MATAQPTVSAREAESMQGRVGGQLLLASIIAEREKKGPQTRSDKFLGRHIFNEKYLYGLFWQALAQKNVSDQLDQSGENWVVLHDVPLPGGTSVISNLVLTSTSVFAVSVLRAFGQPIRVSGRDLRMGKHDSPFLRVMEDEARMASQILTEAAGHPVEVHPILCWLDVGLINIPIAPVDVILTHFDHLLDVIKNAPAALDSEAVNGLKRIVLQPSLWSSTPIESTDSGAVLDDFSSIFADMEQMNRTRKRWKTSIRMTAWLSLLAGALSLYPVLLALGIASN